MKRLLSLLGLVMLASACGGSGSTDPGTQALTVGVYNYSASVPFFKSDGSLGTSNFSGTLTLTSVTAASIAGTFQVTGYRSDTSLGGKNGDAYLLYGYTSAFTSTLAHRIRPDMGCTVRYVGPDPDGTCTLSAR